MRDLMSVEIVSFSLSFVCLNLVIFKRPKANRNLTQFVLLFLINILHLIGQVAIQSQMFESKVFQSR